MKRCSSCGEEKLLTQFRKDRTQKDGLQSRCKLCASTKIRESYTDGYRERARARSLKNSRANRLFLKELRQSFGCALCPERDPVCLEFHHLDPSTKSFELSRYASCPQATLVAEVKKCVCLCSNCHKKVHAGTLRVCEEHLCNPTLNS